MVQRVGLDTQRDSVRATAAFDAVGGVPVATELVEVVPMRVVLTGHDGDKFVRVPIAIRAHVVEQDAFELLIGSSDLAQYTVKVDLAEQRKDQATGVTAGIW